MTEKTQSDDALEVELKKLLTQIGQEPISEDIRALAAKLQTLLDDKTKTEAPKA